MAGNGSEPHRSVVSKVVAIIHSFDSGRFLTVTEIAQVANLSLSTTHRLVHELAAWGVLYRGDDCRFGMRLAARSGGSGSQLSDLRAAAAPVVQDLSAVTRSDVRFGLLDGLRVLYVEKVHGGQPLTAFTAAATLPAHATALGKALLAFSAAPVVDQVIGQGLRRYTSSTSATAARLRHELKVARLRGMVTSYGELRPDHCAVAVPVFGCGGEVLAALEVRIRDTTAELPYGISALKIAARALSRDLVRAAPMPGPLPAAPQEQTVRMLSEPARTVPPLRVGATRSNGN
jgi:DNA-binding IclR family transcriptional regulator